MLGILEVKGAATLASPILTTGRPSSMSMSSMDAAILAAELATPPFFEICCFFFFASSISAFMNSFIALN
jgi:hypothetical protein